MTTIKNTEETRPADLVDELLDGVDEMSLAELEAEIRAEGRDPDEEAEALRGRLLTTLDQFQADLHAGLRATRQLELDAMGQRARPRGDPEVNRRRLRERLAQPGVTAQFRELDSMSDDEVESALAELDYLDENDA
jgi:hypothetical protein